MMIVSEGSVEDVKSSLKDMDLSDIVEAQDDDGFSVVHYCAGKSAELVRLCIDAGADANARAGHMQTTPLMIAVESGDVSIVRELLLDIDDRGDIATRPRRRGAVADVYAQDASGWSPIHYIKQEHEHCHEMWFLLHNHLLKQTPAE